MKPKALLIALTLLVLGACGRNAAVLEPDWAKVIATYNDDETKVYYLRLAELNLALSKQGRLAEDAFKYTQAGQDGLLPEWNMTEEVGVIASDVFFETGHIAYAQRMAFEANGLGEHELNPRMLFRLFQTNLLFKAYPVAEKYLTVLEKAGYDMSAQRRFLYNDAAIADDPLLGDLLKCIPQEDRISLHDGLDEDFKMIIRINPSHHQTVEYLGLYYLLAGDFENFRAFLDEFYGTEALPSLPRSFAEAACIMSELEKGYWKTVGVDKKTYEKYRDFKSRLENGLSEDRYKDTFWYYLMRVNSQ